MRFYSIKFSPAAGEEIPKVLTEGKIDYTLFTSHPIDAQGNFSYNPGCPEVSFEVLTAWAHMITSPFHLQIMNIPAELLQYAKMYNNLICEISAGFQPGNNYGGMLPLEVGPSSHAGVIATGYVQNCFGNWLGTNLVMDFLIYPSPMGSPSLEVSGNDGFASPQNFTFSWAYDANGYYNPLEQELNTWFKEKFNIEVKGTLNPKLAPPPAGIKLNYTVFDKFAESIRAYSVQCIDPANSDAFRNGLGNFQGYRGVSMVYNFASRTIFVWDGTATGEIEGIQLQYSDFIGQPTWTSSAGTVQSVHPMRNDFVLAAPVTYPKQLPQIQSTQYAATGNFAILNASGETLQIQMVRHVGRYRDTSPEAWATFLNAGPAVRYNPSPPAEEV